jgi:predicted DNA-binding transcriptional regulator YafY
MPANKYALLRYRIIDRCILNPGKPFPSREDLRQACEEALYGSGADAISLSTIDKDIWAMKNESELGYLAPIAFHRQHKGYYYEDPEYSISSLSLGDDDLESLRFAAAILNQFRDVPMLEQYENAIEKIINRLNISPDPFDAQLDKYIQFEQSTVSKGNEHLGPLLEAIRKRKVVDLIYRKFSDDQDKSYLIHPYLLKEYRNRWYLIALEGKSASIRTFGLERIEKCTLQKESFRIDENFRADLFFEHSIGITEKQEEPSEVILAFDLIPGKYLQTQPIHSSQKLINEDGKEIQIALKVLLTPELFTFILGYGNQVRVLKPASLKKEITKRLKSALDQYE